MLLDDCFRQEAEGFSSQRCVGSNGCTPLLWTCTSCPSWRNRAYEKTFPVGFPARLQTAQACRCSRLLAWMCCSRLEQEGLARVSMVLHLVCLQGSAAQSEDMQGAQAAHTALDSALGPKQALHELVAGCLSGQLMGQMPSRPVTVH